MSPMPAGLPADQIAMPGPRFAIYFVPAADSALYQFGASVLGYDCYERCEVKLPRNFPLTDAGWMELTAAPPQYGFHGTLKAPFFLKPDVTAADLKRQFQAFAASLRKIP